MGGVPDGRGESNPKRGRKRDERRGMLITFCGFARAEVKELASVDRAEVVSFAICVVEWLLRGDFASISVRTRSFDLTRVSICRSQTLEAVPFVHFFIATA